MPDFGSATFSQTDSSNNSGTMPSWSGSAAPSTIDDAGRALQGAVTREWNWRNYTLTAAGTADAKTLTYSVAPAAYYNGQRFAFLANTTNTGSATLNINSVGAKPIKKDVSGTLTNLSASDMVSGMFVEVAYNTSNDCFVWVNFNASSSYARLASANTFTAANAFTSTSGTGFAATGSGTSGALSLRQTSGDTAGAYIQWTNNAVSVQTGYIVTDTSSNMLFGTGASERMRIDSSGNVGIGGTPAADTLELYSTLPKMSLFASGTKNAVIGIGALTGLSTTLGLNAANASGTLVMGTNNAERMRIDSSGNVIVTGAGGLGYGTGSGGTVTQITSKSTGVTLNKTNGTIVTHNSAVGSTGTAVTFVVTNSTVAATDTVIIHRASGGTSGPYVICVDAVAAGSFTVSIRQFSGGSLSEALTLNFAVIKAVAS